MLQSYNMWTRWDKNKHKSRRHLCVWHLWPCNKVMVISCMTVPNWSRYDLDNGKSSAGNTTFQSLTFILHLHVPTIAVLTFLMPKSWLAPNTGNYYTHMLNLCGPFCVRRWMHTFLALWRNPNPVGSKQRVEMECSIYSRATGVWGSWLCKKLVDQVQVTKKRFRLSFFKPQNWMLSTSKLAVSETENGKVPFSGFPPIQLHGWNSLPVPNSMRLLHKASNTYHG